MIYLVVFIILSILVILEFLCKKEQRIYVLFAGILIIGLFQALRWRTGTDWAPYHDFFLSSNNQTNPNDENFEIGYALLNSSIRIFTSSYTVFLLFFCFLNLFILARFAISMKLQNYSFALLVLFALTVFPIRYTLASSIILCSYKYIIERKILLFILLFLLAYSIHRSVVVFLPFYFIAQKKYSIHLLLAIYFTAILLGLSTDSTFAIVLKYTSIFYSGLGDSFQSKLNSYMTGEVPEYAVMSSIQILLSILNSTFFILLFYYFKKKYFATNQSYNVLFNMYVFGIILNRFFWQIVPDFARITSLFSAGFFIMILMIFSIYRKNIQITFSIIFLGYYFIKYWGIIDGHYSDLFLPYISVFSENTRFVY